MRHLHFLAHASFNGSRQFTPALREPRGIRGMAFETTEQAFQRFESSRLFGGQTSHLFESRIDGTNVVLSIEEHDSFFEPFDDVLQFGSGVKRLSRRITSRA